jgi:hypothetical protein
MERRSLQGEGPIHVMAVAHAAKSPSAGSKMRFGAWIA